MVEKKTHLPVYIQGDRRYFEQVFFEMFQRGAASYMIEGYGVGLAFCKKVVEAAGGTISVHNILNEETECVEGACFSIKLPIVQQ